MAKIGAFQFASMSGRIQPPTISASETDSGFAFGDETQTPFQVSTVTSVASWAAGWSLAIAYRRAIGAVGPMIDGGGSSLPLVLVCDCEVRVKSGIVEATWTILGFPLAPAQVARAAATARSIGLGSTASADRFQLLVNGVLTTWRTMGGDAQPAIRRSQIREVARVAKSWDIKNAPTPERTSGVLEATVECSSEAEALRLVSATRKQIGVGSLDLAGVRFVAEVGAVSVDWQDAKTSPSGQRLVRASWRIGLSSPESPEEDTGGGIVQWATAWGSWVTDRDAECRSVVRCASIRPGTAVVTRPLSQSRGGVLRDVQPVDRTGQWVRVLDRVSRQPVWHGVVLSRRISGAGDGPTIETYACAEPLEAWRQVVPFAWYAQGQGVADVDPGEVLPFNPDASGSFAPDRRIAAGDAPSVHLQDLSGTGTEWTARQVVDLILYAIRKQYPGGPQWTLTGQVAALGYEVGTLDLRGADALNMLAMVCAPETGSMIVPNIAADGTATLVVKTLTKTAITVGGLAIPAHDDQLAVDLTAAQVASWELDEDGQDTVDRIGVEGVGHEVVATLLISKSRTKNAAQAQMCPDWTSAAETAWDSASDDERSREPLSHVWRRFRLQDTLSANATNWWHGHYAVPIESSPGVWGLEAITDAERCSRTIRDLAPNGNVLHGDGGETGELSASVADASRPHPGGVRILRHLPVATGAGAAGTGANAGAEVNWATAGSSSYSPRPGTTPVQGPLLFSLAGAAWADRTEEYQIEVLPDQGRILIGREGDGADIKQILDAGDMYITVGIRNPMPWRLSWRRPKAQRPRDLERAMLVKTDKTFFTIEKGAVLGIDDQGDPVKRTTRLVVGWEDGPNLKQWAQRVLGLSKLWHSINASRLQIYVESDSVAAPGFVEWRTGAESDFVVPVLGQFVTVATCPAGRNRTFQRDVNAVVTEIETDLSTGRQRILCDRITVGEAGAGMALIGQGGVGRGFMGGAQIEPPPLPRGY